MKIEFFDDFCWFSWAYSLYMFFENALDFWSALKEAHFLSHIIFSLPSRDKLVL